jgi:hypothetical protein
MADARSRPPPYDNVTWIDLAASDREFATFEEFAIKQPTQTKVSIAVCDTERGRANCAGNVAAIQAFFASSPPREFLARLEMLLLEGVMTPEQMPETLVQALREMSGVTHLSLDNSDALVDMYFGARRDGIPVPPRLETLLINGAEDLASLRNLAPAAPTLRHVAFTCDYDDDGDFDRTDALADLAALPLQQELELELSYNMRVRASVRMPASTTALSMRWEQREASMPLHRLTPRLRRLDLSMSPVSPSWLSSCLPASLVRLDLSECTVEVRQRDKRRGNDAAGGLDLVTLDLRRLTALEWLSLKSFNCYSDVAAVRVRLPRPATPLRYLDLRFAGQQGVDVGDIQRQLQEQGVAVPELRL